MEDGLKASKSRFSGGFLTSKQSRPYKKDHLRSEFPGPIQGICCVQATLLNQAPAAKQNENEEEP